MKTVRGHRLRLECGTCRFGHHAKLTRSQADMSSAAVQLGSQPQDIPTTTPEGVFLVHDRTCCCALGSNFDFQTISRLLHATIVSPVLYSSPGTPCAQLPGRQCYHGLTLAISPSGPFRRSSSGLDPSAYKIRIPTRSGSESLLPPPTGSPPHGHPFLFFSAPMVPNHTS